MLLFRVLFCEIVVRQCILMLKIIQKKENAGFLMTYFSIEHDIQLKFKPFQVFLICIKDLTENGMHVYSMEKCHGLLMHTLILRMIAKPYLTN